MTIESMGARDGVSYILVRSSWWYKLVHSSNLKLIILITSILIIYVVYRIFKNRKLDPMIETKPIDEKLKWRKLNG